MSKKGKRSKSKSATAELVPIRWRAKHAKPRHTKVVYGPNHRPWTPPRLRVRTSGGVEHLDRLEVQALASFRAKQLDAWLGALGLTSQLDAMSAHLADSFRRYFSRCAGETAITHLHTLQVGRDTDTGEQLLVSCSWPAQPQVRWRPPPTRLDTEGNPA